MTEPLGTVPKISRKHNENEIKLAAALQVVLRSIAIKGYVRKGIRQRANELLGEGGFATIHENGNYSYE